MSILGDNLKSARKALMLSQSDVADILRNKYNLKSDRVAISKWETGFQVPNIYTLKCLAEIYGVSLDALNDIPSNSASNKTPHIIAANTITTDGEPVILHSYTSEYKNLQHNPKKDMLIKIIQEGDIPDSILDFIITAIEPYKK